MGRKARLKEFRQGLKHLSKQGRLDLEFKDGQVYVVFDFSDKPHEHLPSKKRSLLPKP